LSCARETAKADLARLRSARRLPSNLSGPVGSYTVDGTHTYASPGTYSIKVTVVDALRGTLTVVVVSTAQVTP
jgi:hypothetical protein